MLLFLSRTTIIGIILVIAVVAVSLAVCLYLASLPDKKDKE